MSLSNNFPDIQPSLNLSFALTKKLDPRITFTRTTTATYYDGKTTTKAEENLLKYSQAFTDASWTDTDCTVTDNDATAPDGTSTAATMLATNANAVLTQGYTAIAGSYTFSVWLRRVTGTGDIEIAADNGTWTTKVITGTWARYDVTQTVAAGSKTAGIRIVTDTDEIEVWGAQLEQRSAVTAYTPTTTQPITNYIPTLLTAASGVARFDHNPTTGESLGLLVEEQRTNLLTYSEDFSTNWAVTRAGVTTNTVVAPDGTLTGVTLVANTDNNTHFVRQGNFTFTSGVTYTFSVYVKAAGYSFVAIRGDSTSGVLGAAVYFSLTDGSVTQSASGVTTTSTDVGNGWYRLSVTATATATESTGRPTVYLTNVGTGASFGVSFAGDDYAGVFLWGAQLEAGAFPTSYIATTSASVTRNADVATMTGTNFSSWYAQPGGTTFVEAVPVYAIPNNVVSNDRGIVSYSIGTFGTGYAIRQLNEDVSAYGRFGSGSIASTTGFEVTVGQAFKTTAVFSSTERAISFNGGAVAFNTVILADFTPTQMLIGNQEFSSSSPRNWNGRIKKIAFYPARLSDSQLQALTTV